MAKKKARPQAPKPRHILMLGTAPSCMKAPLHDPRLEVWAPNGSGFPAAAYARVDRWFQIHRIEGEPGYDLAPGTRSWLQITMDATKPRRERWMIAQDPMNPKEAPEWLEETGNHDAWMYLFYPEEGVRNARLYPVDDISARYGTYFIRSTFDWMMIQAIDEMRGPVKKVECSIEIAGVDMEFDTEYFDQRDSMHHWMDIARQLGIKVDLPVTSGLAYVPVPYPWSEDEPEKAKLVHQRNYHIEQKKSMDDVVRSGEMSISNFTGQLIALEPYRAEKGVTQSVTELREMQLQTRAQVDKAGMLSAQHDAVIKHISWHLNYLSGCGGDPSTREDRTYAG